MPEKKRVAVLFGGHSSEYGVSLQSAASVLEEIDRENLGDDAFKAKIISALREEGGAGNG